MASITTRNASVSFPLIGPDGRGFLRAKKQQKNTPSNVGGAIKGGAKPSVSALNKINLDLVDGDRLAIYGHNGSGKSTLLRLLAGIYPPSSGTVEINGTTAGMFSLTLGTIQDASGIENIRFKGIMHGLSKREIDELIPQIAEFSELGDYLHLPMKTYSSGMSMRLMFATASMMRPDILLLDEWVSAGDQNFRKKADQFLESILETTPIVIIASQNLRRLSAWSNKLIHLKAGTQSEPPALEPLPFKPDPEAVRHFKKLNNLHRYDEALEAVETTWPHKQAPWQYYANKAAILVKAKRLDEAETVYQQALQENDNDAALHNALGKLKFRLNDPKAACEHISRALEISDHAIGDVILLEKAKLLIEKQ